MTKANNKWRDDPVRREAAMRLLEAQDLALTQAHGHLTAAYELLSKCPNPKPDTIGMPTMIKESASYAFRAMRRVRECMPVIPNDPDCLIGNMAAFGEGLS